MVNEAQELLDKQDGVTPVHNRFYELSSNYHKLMGNHAEYYRDALRYLGCTELSTIPGKVSFLLFPLFAFFPFLLYKAGGGGGAVLVRTEIYNI